MDLRLRLILFEHWAIITIYERSRTIFPNVQMHSEYEEIWDHRKNTNPGFILKVLLRSAGGGIRPMRLMGVAFFS